VPLLLLGPPFLSDYYFLVHPPVNWDGQHLLARARASAFSVTWQFSQREQLFLFFVIIKLYALIRLGFFTPSFDTGAQNGVL
jgi:hypothetical protein